MRFGTLASSLVVLASALPAQTDGWAPPAHARRNGNNGFAMPGNWSIGRYQAIINASDLPAGLTSGKVLNKIAYRRTNYPSIITASYVAKSMTVEVAIGNTATPGSGLSTTWATNQPGDRTVVLPLGNLNFPNDPPIGVFNEVGPDIMVYPFTTPKLFTGPNLFVEHINNTPLPLVTSTYWADALDNRSPAIPFGHNAIRGSAGCGAAVSLPTNLRAPTNASGNQLGGSTVYTISAATPSTAFLFNIGIEMNNPYGLPAPFNLAPIGAPGCPFWNTMDLVLTGATTAAGTGTQTISFPNDPSLSGAQVGMQALVVSPGFNAANLTSSNGISAWIGARYPLTSSQVLELNNLASLSAPATGLYIAALPITHLFWL